MRQPHAYKPRDPNAPWYQTRCAECGGQPGETIHLYALPGMERLTQYRLQQDEERPAPNRIDTSQTMELFS